MININSLSLRNFLSIGNATQAIRFDQNGLTLVIGENLDASGIVRNGAGKTSILQAVSYALFGKPLTKIKVNNLVNNINNKQMLVAIEFERDGTKYKIERGRKPDLMRYFVNNALVVAPDDDAQGDSRQTQKDIETVLGFSHLMFKHIVALNTFTDPFLKMGAGEQRDVIEELLGIMAISQKAEQLKLLIKGTKGAIGEEEFRIKTQLELNQKIHNTITDLELKSRAWENNHQRSITTSETQLGRLQEVDIDVEIAAHAALAAFTEGQRELKGLQRSLDAQVATSRSALARLTKDIAAKQHEKSHFEKATCPTCLQPVNDRLGKASLEELDLFLANSINDHNVLKNEVGTLQEQLNECRTALADMGAAPEPYYRDAAKAYEHRHTVETLTAKLASDRRLINPYRDQIDTMREENLIKIDYDYLNELTVVLKHQEFVLKLLTSKDSFVRKKIIDQNLNHLNHRLNHYLDRLGLAHEVRFMADLTVEISLLGREFDFEQLSRGEMNRLNLANSFSFRDVWESLNQSLNLLFVDENIDSGMDQHGSESALEVLKAQGDRGKSVFLISHKDELVSRVQRILLVRKENSFTRFDDTVDSIE